MMVFFILNDRAGAVHLLGKDQPHQLMGKYQPGQAPPVLGSFKDGIIQAIGASYEKDQVARCLGGLFFNKVRQPG